MVVRLHVGDHLHVVGSMSIDDHNKNHYGGSGGLYKNLCLYKQEINHFNIN